MLRACVAGTLVLAVHARGGTRPRAREQLRQRIRWHRQGRSASTARSTPICAGNFRNWRAKGHSKQARHSGRALGAYYEVDNRIAHLLLGNRFLRRNGVKPDAPKRVGVIAIDCDRQLTVIFRQLDFWRIEMAANHDAALACELKRIGLNLGRPLQNLGPAHLRSGFLSRSPLHPRFVMLFKLIRHSVASPLRQRRPSVRPCSSVCTSYGERIKDTAPAQKGKAQRSGRALVSEPRSSTWRSTPVILI